MNDRFEDAVRDALHGLPSSSGELPTYHDAWHRGRRRRMVKRSVLAAAGALVFVAALTVNLGRLPGSGSTEVDDVATGAEAATVVFEPTPLATTSPLETPDQGAASIAPSIEIPTSLPEAAEPAPSVEPDPEPTATAVPVPQPTVAAPAPTAAATSTPVPTAPTPVPTAPTEPTAEATAQPTPGPTEVASVPESDPLQAADTGPAADPGDDPSDASGTAQQPADPGSPDAPTPDPAAAFTTAAGSADATILGGAARGVALPCDLDADGVSDAACELLVEYGCTGEGDVQPGYTAIDADGDGEIETCIAVNITVCDTTQDGLGDTPCIIELTVVGDEESQADG